MIFLIVLVLKWHLLLSSTKRLVGNTKDVNKLFLQINVFFMTLNPRFPTVRRALIAHRNIYCKLCKTHLRFPSTNWKFIKKLAFKLFIRSMNFYAFYTSPIKQISKDLQFNFFLIFNDKVNFKAGIICF